MDPVRLFVGVVHESGSADRERLAGAVRMLIDRNHESAYRGC
jgi:hypothetical protein